MGDLIVKQALGLDMTSSMEFVHNGRPLKFTPEEFNERVEKYFQWCEDEKKPLTIARLACFLNCDRNTILRYGHKDEFCRPIKRLREYILASKEENLISGKGSTVGLIFDLKNNHGFKDEQNIEVTTTLIPVTLAEDEEKEIIDVTPEKKVIEDHTD